MIQQNKEVWEALKTQAEEICRLATERIGELQKEKQEEERRLKEKIHGLKDVVQSQGDNTKEDARRAVESALRKHKRFATAETRVALQEARQKRDAL